MSGQAFGRVPPETVGLFERTVALVRTELVGALPFHASAAVRAETVEMVLAIILRDWQENGNTTGMVASDVEDLKNFIRLAVTLAGDDLNGQGRPVYASVLKGLLEDWLANWNSAGDPGPPGPIN